MAKGSSSSSPSSTVVTRTSPFLPSPQERLVLAVFPILLVFGTLFSVVSPDTRAAVYDPVSQSYAQDPAVAPNYFARKSNIFNVVFVKRGWGWVTVAFFVFLATQPSSPVSQAAQASQASVRRALRAGIRWAGVTACWFCVTQWFFGAPLIDRGFRWTGGKCELAERTVYMGGPGEAGVGEMVTAVACKAAGGKWKGGHDISGHVFLLVLGTAFLMGEVGWPYIRRTGWVQDDRVVVMPDGAVKRAGVEAEADDAAGRRGPGARGEDSGLGLGSKFAFGVVGLNVWMLLMTAIYFHTWFEKFTGLLTALISWYFVYIVPRFVPGLRAVVGLPGI